MVSISMPLPSLRRLLIYYRHLKSAVEKGAEYVSSNDLGWAADTTPEQVRKDLSFLPGQGLGRSRVGYPAHKLAAVIEDYLGLLNDKYMVLVGVGNLGRALALFEGFQQHGMRIIVMFDNDPDKVGTKVGEIKVLPVEKLTNLVERMMIRIGIITTPADAAQSVADAMVAGGIKAIWNFTTVRLNVPTGVMVQNVDLSLDLLMLSQYIHHQSLQGDLSDPSKTLVDDDIMAGGEHRESE